MSKIIFKATAIFIAVIICVLPSSLSSSTEIVGEYKPTYSIEEYVEIYSTLYGADKHLVASVGQCESNLNPKVKPGDGGRSHGPFMYNIETWKRYSKMYVSEFGGSMLDINSYHDQAKLTSWVYSLGKKEYMREWTTYVAIERGGEYSFYSRVLKGHYTVKCKYKTTLV